MHAVDGKVPILGIGGDGLAGLAARSRELLTHADLVYGSDAVLQLLPELTAERYRIGADLQATLESVRANLGKRIVIVASGDPLFYGVARYLCDKLGKERFDVIPHVSSMQLAFARIKESWEDAYLTDVGNRALDDVLDRIRSAETVGLFTSVQHDPPTIARELLARGIDYFRVYVCENLGGPDERVTQGDLAEIAEHTFDPLNVMILKRKPDRPDVPSADRKLMRFGNPDDVFAQSRPKSGLITQAEVRALALAQLDLHPGMIVWDVGAGSGSVSIEAGQLVHPGTVYAIEQEAPDYHLILANCESFGIKNVKPVFGMAPAVFHGLPQPHAIFIGGNGGEVARLMESSYAALRTGGRLVVNVGTLEMLTAVRSALQRLTANVYLQLVSVARGVEQLEALRFEAVNPTFLLTVIKQ